jgi:hypothetical protein
MKTPLQIMEDTWETLPKNKDGKTITYFPGDVDYLYDNGFVDTMKWSRKQWQGAFETFPKNGKNYILTRDDFLALTLFRYNGPVGEPFDPQKLREGPWEDEELDYLYLRSIKPSSAIKEEIYWASVKSLKESGQVDDKGNLVVDEAVKKQLAYLLDKFPSPRRKLEKEVTRLRKERGIKIQKQSENRDASGFMVGETDSEVKAKDLKSLESYSSPAQQPPSDDDGKPSVSLKDLKKPKGTIKG